MEKQSEFFVRPDGVIECLYTEEITLQALGKLSVDRASHVEFVNDLQMWGVTFTEKSAWVYEGIRYFATREAALAWEEQEINRSMVVLHSLINGQKQVTTEEE